MIDADVNVRPTSELKDADIHAWIDGAEVESEALAVA